MTDIPILGQTSLTMKEMELGLKNLVHAVMILEEKIYQLAMIVEDIDRRTNKLPESNEM